MKTSLTRHFGNKPFNPAYR